MLPIPNGEAVRQAIRVGLALGCEIPAFSKWDRKNYFYPDSPKAYQISQYDQPLCSGGRFHVPDPEGGFEVGIVRAHLEEDAAKMIHEGGGGGRIAGSSGSVVDFNRGGHAAARDRHRARPALAGAGAPLPQPAARDHRGHRRVRLRHGEGLAALRRQRLRPPRGRRPSSGPRPSSRT